MWSTLQAIQDLWHRCYFMMRSNKALVDILATDHASNELFHEMLRRGERIVPDLIRSLSRPDFGRPYEHKAENPYELRLRSPQTLLKCNLLRPIKTPMIAVLECLEFIRDESCITAVAKLVDHPESEVREIASSVFVAIGSEACIEPLKAFVSNAGVASNVASELRRAMSEGECSDELREALFEPLFRQLTVGSSLCSQNLASCLIEMDRGKATALLTAPGFISPARKNAGGLLGELMRNNVLLPEAVLLDLIQSAEAEPRSYSNESLLEAAIKMLSSYDSPTTRAELIRHQTSKVKDVRIEAWEGFLRLEGVGDPWQALAGLNSTNIGQADVRLRTAARIRDIIDQVANGGFSQWYVNGFGHEWKETRDALIAVGATNSVGILDSTLSTFGPKGPPSGDDLDEAVRQIHAATEELPWEEETRDFGTDPDDLEVLLLKYMIEHKEVFGRKP